MQAVVLGVLPPVAFAAIYFLNRSYADVLLERPKLLAGVFGMQAVGAWWVRKIIKFEY
jgi:tight adherence protein B